MTSSEPKQLLAELLTKLDELSLGCDSDRQQELQHGVREHFVLLLRSKSVYEYAVCLDQQAWVYRPEHQKLQGLSLQADLQAWLDAGILRGAMQLLSKLQTQPLLLSLQRPRG